MRILIWHVHGSWLNAFVRGPHDYLLPVTADRGPDGRGRARTWQWPASVREVTPDELAMADVDVVVLQRPHEEQLATRWLRRGIGGSIPIVYVEHNTPRGDAPNTRHPMADRQDVRLVHVTHFNDLMWDAGKTATTVIEHGVVDPGACYTGELPRIGVAVNEPIRRGRVTGTDLLPAFAGIAPIDVFGMRVEGLAKALGIEGDAMSEFDDPPQHVMHAELARRRVYLHLTRWTSLGLSLIEAMLLGMPVVALATTAAPDAVPPDAGVVSTRIDDLRSAVRNYLHDPEEARVAGAAGRRTALARFGADRFVADWNRLLSEVTA
jgi:hypothetical protein